MKYDLRDLHVVWHAVSCTFKNINFWHCSSVRASRLHHGTVESCLSLSIGQFWAMLVINIMNSYMSWGLTGLYCHLTLIDDFIRPSVPQRVQIRHVKFGSIKMLYSVQIRKISVSETKCVFLGFLQPTHPLILLATLTRGTWINNTKIQHQNKSYASKLFSLQQNDMREKCIALHQNVTTNLSSQIDTMKLSAWHSLER